MTPDPTQDRATAELERIRDRWSKVAYVGLKPEVVPEPGHQPSWLADIPHLLAAVDAVLKLADEAEPVDRDYGGEPIWWSLTPAEIRAAITRELTGGGE